MFTALRRSASSEGVRDRFVIAPSHPDRLGRPPARLGAIERERFQQALAWNVFRTLELLPPAFWLRRLNARLGADPSSAAAQMLRVSLWRSLPLPPIQRLDGSRSDVLVDVVVETEHAVWTLIVASDAQPTDDGERLARAIDAGTWLAGRRCYHCGVIEAETTATSSGGVLAGRYSRSRVSAGVRSATRGPTAPESTPCGTVQWTDLAAILREGQESSHLSEVEHAVARNACAWLQRVGVDTVVGARP